MMLMPMMPKAAGPGSGTVDLDGLEKSSMAVSALVAVVGLESLAWEMTWELEGSLLESAAVSTSVATSLAVAARAASSFWPDTAWCARAVVASETAAMINVVAFML